MNKRRFMSRVLVALAICVLALPSGAALAADLDEDLNYKAEVTFEEQKEAGQRFLEAYLEAKDGQVGVAAVSDDHILDPESGLYIAHYFGPYPNYSLSPLPTVTRDAGGLVTNLTGGIRKFVDSLPLLTAAGANNLGQFLPVAVPDQDTFPGSDYYEIAVVEVEEQLHSDLPPTKLRQYVQLSTDVVPGDEVLLVDADGNNILMPDGSQAYGVTASHYLGPVIVAQKDRPVRVRFFNLLPIGAEGDLFIPTDTTQMGAGMGGVMDMFTGEDIYFTQNRATLHLHGGRTPWISDGTPHQWITPAGEDTPYPQGVSVYDVPDMWFDANGNAVPEGTPGASSDPGDGSMTFFYTNQQSARFMFYHDHSFGITRLNVYGGAAAGYMIQDEVELDLIARGIIPEEQIPLVIQDKTFVPDPTIPFSNIFGDWDSQDAFYDPTWDYDRWGDFGDLWYPHVYMSVQNPYDLSGVNAFGRWHYGPWFWPPTIDTIEYHPIPNPYADPANPGYSPLEPPYIPGTPTNSAGMESFFDTPVVNGTVYPYLEVDPKAYRFRILNAANDRFWNLQLHVADPDVVTFDGRSNTEVRMVPAEETSGLPEGWPTDGRVGGVPDPLLIGPEMIQIGTEGGFLPEPVVLPNQPIVWNLDPTTFNVGNVESGNLILGPAERADVIVDFSAYAGQTLILYNDAPAPFPALAPQYDYYTGAPDMSDTGSAPGTEPGFGPNTRTIMQIRVADSPVADPYDLATLNDEFVPGDGTGVFVRGQDEIIVGQSAYDAVYNTTFPSTAPYWGYSNIQDNDLSFQTVAGDLVDDFPMQPKAIQDEMGEAFDDYGRMSGFLGLELPRTQAGANNFVLSGFTDPPVDLIPLGPGYDNSQIWKITHNGVDTHPIHFHLYDVQVINRVGWDGGIRLPDANEIGWKDTVRVSPLEDTIVALRPVVPTFPFDIPNSIRLLDPTQPEGAVLNSSTDVELTGLGLMSFAPNGEPIDIFNHYVNFGWEYVWHCHILSHEEMDMMHIQMVAVPPAAPSNVTAVGMSGPFRISLNWTNNALNATGFVIERATDSGFTTNLVTWNVGLVPAFVDTTAVEGESYFYRVAAVNLVGDTWDYSDPAINEGAEFPTVAMMSPYSVAVFGQAGATGLLRVQTIPAVPTTIHVDGLPRDDWGLNYVKLPAGNYQLSFSDVHGFASPTQFSVTQAGVGPVVQPVSSPITIVEGEVTEVIVNYSELGNLHIMTSPPVPATLFVDGWPSEDWGLWTYFQPGQYDIIFGDLSGYTSPAPTTVTVTAGATTEITGAYSGSANEVIQPPHGLFHVQTSPAVRTSITVDGHPSDDWGLTYVKLSPGEYMLDFTDVAGFRTPTQVSVTTNGGDPVMMPLSSPIPIGDGDVLDVVATFEAIGNLWVQTSPPVPATIFCNGEPMDDWGFWTYLDPGVYTVSFETLAGFTTPAPIDVTVTAGATTHVVGDFNTGVTTLVP